MPWVKGKTKKTKTNMFKQINNIVEEPAHRTCQKQGVPSFRFEAKRSETKAKMSEAKQ